MKLIKQELVSLRGRKVRRWIVECPICNRTTYMTPSDAKKRKTCSKRCSLEYRKNPPQSKPEEPTQPLGLLCIPPPPETLVGSNDPIIVYPRTRR